MRREKWANALVVKDREKNRKNGSVSRRYSPEETPSFGGSPADVRTLGTSITPLAVTVLTLYCRALYEPTVPYCRGGTRGLNVHISPGLP